MISACYSISFRKNQVFSKSGRPLLSVRFCALNKPPLMRELPLPNLTLPNLPTYLTYLPYLPNLTLRTDYDD